MIFAECAESVRQFYSAMTCTVKPLMELMTITAIQPLSNSVHVHVSVLNVAGMEL